MRALACRREGIGFRVSAWIQDQHALTGSGFGRCSRVEVDGAHLDVVAWWVMLGEVVGEVAGAGGPLDDELALADSVLDPVEAHVVGFGALDAGALVGESVGGRVVSDDWGWSWLFMA